MSQLLGCRCRLSGTFYLVPWFRYLRILSDIACSLVRHWLTTPLRSSKYCAYFLRVQERLKLCRGLMKMET